MRGKMIAAILGLTLIAGLYIILAPGISATIHNNDLALILVSNYEGYNENEMDKASDLYDYLINEGYTSSNIKFLGNTSWLNVDNDGSKSNFETEMNWMDTNTNTNKEVIIYISDHGRIDDGNVSYQFDDGIVTLTSIETWLDDIESSSITYISLGEKSGLFGDTLQGQDRVIIASMSSTENVNPDRFDIVRSLTNSSSDSNSDGKVSFIEAFNAEYDIVIQYQTPLIWD